VVFVGCCLSFVSINIIVYADDILLLAPTVCGLQNLVKLCVEELTSLNMGVNYRKSVCLRIGSRYEAPCANVMTNEGHTLNWVKTCRYLGVFITSSRRLKCDLTHSKASFYRAFYAIFGKIHNIASEEVLLTLIRSKCLPVLLYGLEACPLVSSERNSLDFVLTRCFMKMSRTGSSAIVNDCQRMLSFLPARFLDKMSGSPNGLCNSVFVKSAATELDTLCKGILAKSCDDFVYKFKHSFLHT
jgi:hypothetical protein